GGRGIAAAVPGGPGTRLPAAQAGIEVGVGDQALRRGGRSEEQRDRRHQKKAVLHEILLPLVWRICYSSISVSARVAAEVQGLIPPSPLLHLRLFLLLLARGRGPGRDVLRAHRAFRQAGVAAAVLLDVDQILRAREDGAAAEPLLLGFRWALRRQAGEEEVEDLARQAVALARVDVA